MGLWPERLNLLLTERYVWRTSLTPEECQARLAAGLQPRFRLRMPPVRQYPVKGSVSPTGFRVERVIVGRWTTVGLMPFEIAGQFGSDEKGTMIAGRVGVRRVAALFWLFALIVFAFGVLTTGAGCLLDGVPTAPSCGHEVLVVFMLLMVLSLVAWGMHSGRQDGKAALSWLSATLETETIMAWKEHD